MADSLPTFDASEQSPGRRGPPLHRLGHQVQDLSPVGSSAEVDHGVLDAGARRRSRTTSVTGGVSFPPDLPDTSPRDPSADRGEHGHRSRLLSDQSPQVTGGLESEPGAVAAEQDARPRPDPASRARLGPSGEDAGGQTPPVLLRHQAVDPARGEPELHGLSPADDSTLRGGQSQQRGRRVDTTVHVPTLGTTLGIDRGAQTSVDDARGRRRPVDGDSSPMSVTNPQLRTQ